MNRFFRVTNDPQGLRQLLAQTEHLITKDGGGNFYCETHRRPASQCVQASASDLVWSDSLDGGRYVACVMRTKPYRGLLTLTRDDVVIFQDSVGLAYNAPFGPDSEDVDEWQRRCTEAADADYRRRGETPPP